MTNAPLTASASSSFAPQPEADLQLARDAAGALVMVLPGGQREAVTPVRAFPFSAPDAGISLVGTDGRERHWVAQLDAVPAAARALIAEALAPREFAPVLLRLRSVSSFGVPSTWDVSTDRGDTRFVLRAEEDIRRLDGGALLITSAHGLQFRVPDRKALDRPSRKLIERFL